MSLLPVVDSHHHLWDTNDGNYAWMVGPFAALKGVHDMSELVPLLVSSNVRSTVVVQARSDLEESVTLLRCASLRAEISGVVGWVDLTSPAVGEQIGRLRASEGGGFLIGIRHAVADEADPGWLQRADVIRGLAAVRDAGLAFDLEVTERELGAAVATADRFPDLRLVVDHLAKPDIRHGISQRWIDGIATIAARPNVSAKISGLVTEADWRRWTVGELQFVIDLALKLFGPKRLMFGSDWPVCQLAAPYGVVLAAVKETISRLSSVEQADILSTTAQTFYELPSFVESY